MFSYQSNYSKHNAKNAYLNGMKWKVVFPFFFVVPKGIHSSFVFMSEPSYNYCKMQISHIFLETHKKLEKKFTTWIYERSYKIVYAFKPSKQNVHRFLQTFFHIFSFWNIFCLVCSVYTVCFRDLYLTLKHIFESLSRLNLKLNLQISLAIHWRYFH